ncbi:MAG: hypothetical protein OXC44_01570 [Proteobacteria bacterium]|nr:hypothetical protein [Pseudomonadota bacterium]
MIPSIAAIIGVTRKKRFSIFDPEDLKVEALLFQSGYLLLIKKS